MSRVVESDLTPVLAKKRIEGKKFVSSLFHVSRKVKKKRQKRWKEFLRVE